MACSSNVGRSFGARGTKIADGPCSLPFSIKAIMSDSGSEDICSIQVTATKIELC